MNISINFSNFNSINAQWREQSELNKVESRFSDLNERRDYVYKLVIKRDSMK